VEDLKCPYCNTDEYVRPWGFKNPITGESIRLRCQACNRTFVKYPINRKPYAKDMGTEKASIGIIPEVKVTQTVSAGLRAVALFDSHLLSNVRPHVSHELAMQYVIDTKPNLIIYGGDLLDFNCISFWNRNRPLLNENQRYHESIEKGRREMGRLRKACPDAEMVFIEGNHEDRVARWVESIPALEGKVNFIKDMGFKDEGITAIPFGGIYKRGHLSYLHGIYYNKYYARTTLENLGESCVFGHAHKYQVWTQRLHFDKQPHIAVGLPCLTDLDPAWKRGTPTNFVNGFGIIEYKNDTDFNVYVPIIINGSFSYAGRTWST